MRKISTFLILSACLSAVLFGVNMHLNLRAWLLTWGQGLQLTVYLAPDTTNAVSSPSSGTPTTDHSSNEQSAAQPRSDHLSIDGIKAQIESLPFVAEVKTVNPEEVLKEFESQMASRGVAASLKAEELVQAIPPSFLVNLKKDTEDLDRIKLIQNAVLQIKKIEGVESVDYGQAWVDQFSNIVHGLSFLWFSLGGLLFVVAGSLVFNSIRVMILERKSEIEVLELLGADRFFIQRPFIQEGAFLGLGAAVAATAVNFIIFYLFKIQMAQNGALVQLGSQLKNIDLTLMIVLWLTGIFIGGLSALFSVRKINSGWAAAESS
jgi:cell division transport system permease protein